MPVLPLWASESRLGVKAASKGVLLFNSLIGRSPKPSRTIKSIFFIRDYLTLGKSAGMTLNTTFFVMQRSSAIRANTHNLPMHIKIRNYRLIAIGMLHGHARRFQRNSGSRAIQQPLFNHAGNGIGARKYTLSLFPGRAGATDIA